MKYKILPALLLFCTLFSLAAREITRNGAPCARIAVAKDAPYVEQFAAKDLQHWIREISGAELPIVNEAGKEGGTTIFIGKTFAERLWQKEIAELNGSDGFAVRSVGSRIYLFGSVPRASAYAAAALLERNTDIIWARPDEKTGCVFSEIPIFASRNSLFWKSPHSNSTAGMSSQSGGTVPPASGYSATGATGRTRLLLPKRETSSIS